MWIGERESDEEQRVDSGACCRASESREIGAKGVDCEWLMFWFSLIPRLLCFFFWFDQAP